MSPQTILVAVAVACGTIVLALGEGIMFLARVATHHLPGDTAELVARIDATNTARGF